MNKDKRNNIQLLGTLNNADESGIIANANQIYDANEDKSTQDVSKEHKERIETLETKESSMQTTLENITKTGEASAASNVTYNHNDSQLDATNVQQAVDKVKALLDNKANKVDVVFDISAYHATGGTLATYADLTAALGTNGKNIPQSLRKGGMSVKFVQSSDNKYVQYRLMSDTFNTIPADWQYSNENIEYAKNGTGVTVPKGKVVYINSSTGDNPIFQLATNADYAIASRAWGVTMDSINNNAVGRIIYFGMIKDLDTSAYTAGTELWLGTNGEYTSVRPTSPAFQTSIGMVIRQSATVGSIFVNIRYVSIIRTYDAGVIPTIKNGTDNDYKQAAINLVPESLHVGGMTVLYSKQGDTAKQSIFLPLSSWSTSVEYWRPSNGGSTEEETEKKNPFDKTYLTISGKGLDTKGEEKAYDSFLVSDFVEIPKDTLFVEATGLGTDHIAGDYMHIAFFDAEKSYVYGFSAGDGEAIVTKDVKYFRFYAESSKADSFTLNAVARKLNAMEEAGITKYNIEISVKGELRTKQGYVINGQGGISTNSNVYRVSEIFSINDFDRLAFNISKNYGGDYYTIALYNKEDDSYNCVKVYQAVGDYELDIHSLGDDIYIRIGNLGLNNVVLKKTNTTITEQMEDKAEKSDLDNLKVQLYGKEESEQESYNNNSNIGWENGALLSSGGYDGQNIYQHSKLLSLENVESITYTGLFNSASGYCGCQLFNSEGVLIGYNASASGTFNLTEYPDVATVRFMRGPNTSTPTLVLTKVFIGDIKTLQNSIQEISGNSNALLNNSASRKTAYFLGDSITYGAFGGGYVERVQRKLGLASVSKYAVNGLTSSGLKSMVIGGSIDFTKCDIVCIFIGTNGSPISTDDAEKDMPDISLNDITSYPYEYSSDNTTVKSATLKSSSDYYNKLFADTYTGHIAAMVEYIQSTNHNCKIFLVVPYVTKARPWLRNTRKALINIGVHYGIPIIDLQGNIGMSEKTIWYYDSDLLHPSREGNRIISDYIAREIMLHYFARDN